MRTQAHSIPVPADRIQALQKRLVIRYGIPEISIPFASTYKAYGTVTWKTPGRIYKIEYERDIITDQRKFFLTVTSNILA